jgi:hypothetical protein
MTTKQLSTWLKNECQNSEPKIPDALMPACIECEETTGYVMDALSHANMIQKQHDELCGLMPQKIEYLGRDMNETIYRIAQDLQEKLEIIP